MSQASDFYTIEYSDNNLTITLSPSLPIGDWTIRFRQFKNFGGGQPLVLGSGQASGLLEVNKIEKWVGPGTGDGSSGITITSSGTGILRIYLPPSEVSGMDAGAYAFTVDRVDSGYNKRLADGYRLITQ